MDTATLGKFMLVFGLAIAALGGIVWLMGNSGIPPGKLPGDIAVDGRNWSFRFPVVTCIVLSVVLTIALNLISRWWGK